MYVILQYNFLPNVTPIVQPYRAVRRFIFGFGGVVADDEDVTVVDMLIFSFRLRTTDKSPTRLHGLNFCFF